MNGNNGIVPTIDLATNNGGYAYPFVPMYNNSGFGGFGSDGIWAIVLLALLFNNGWGNGFGGNNGFNNLATTDYISSEFTQRDINGGFQNQSNLISNGFSNNAQDICNLRSEVLENRYANQLAESTTQRDVLMQTTQLENQANIIALQNQSKLDTCCCELKAQGLENTQRILDALNQNTIADLREKLNEAQTEISNRNIESSIINSVRPFPTPSYIVGSPYTSIYNPYGYNGGYYGNGFYGNTII